MPLNNRFQALLQTFPFHFLFEPLQACVAPRSSRLPRQTASAILALLSLVFTVSTAAQQPSSSVIKVTSLTCEYLSDPLGVDVPAPRLAWQLQSSKNGDRQTAYQILVANAASTLAQDRGDCWNTGKVASDHSIQIPYSGAPLRSAQKVFWKVRVWDAAGRPSAWSKPATWEMGLLHPNDWQAKWIGSSNSLPDLRPDLFGATWIWKKQNERDTADASSSTLTFQTNIHVATQVLSARGLFYTSGICSLFVNNRFAAQFDDKHLQPANVAPLLQPGNNMIRVVALATGAVKSFVGQMKFTFGDSTVQILNTDSSWTIETPEKGLIWQIGLFDHRPLQSLPHLPLPDAPAPLLRKSFSLSKAVRTARVYVSGLGYYELYLNGSKVGDHVLDPGFTNYSDRVLYATYDVTRQLRHGANAVGLMLGNGLYNQRARDVWYFHRAPWRATPRAILQLQIVFEDGSRQTITSDGTWKQGTGALVSDAIRNGETYDARLEKPNWSSARFADDAWKPVMQVDPPAGKLSSQQMPPVKVMQTIPVSNIKSPASDTMLLDLKQNIAGWLRISIRAPRGTVVRIRYGEKLDSNGRVDQSNINWFLFQGDFQTDMYISKGEGIEQWEPRFVYHGFQYAEISGLKTSQLIRAEGRVVHTAFSQEGTFSCSDSLLNRIQQNTVWSYRSNYIGIPVDCPQREKNGWLADAHLAMETGLYNFENTAAYSSWINDLYAAQIGTGQLPGIAPSPGWGYDNSGGPVWESALELIPWYLFQYRNDTNILRRSFPYWQKHLDYLTANAKDHLLDWGLGDWLAIERTASTITSSAYYFCDANLASKAAAILGNDQQATAFATLAANIKSAFQKRFLNKETGGIGDGTEASQCVALYFHLIDPQYEPLVAKYLVNDIARHDNHFTIGAIGHKMILQVLMDAGYPEVAFRLATNDTYPSWGYWIRQGATTLWEEWNGNGSHNHIFLGDISAWMYKTIAGVRLPDTANAFRSFEIRPYLFDSLRSAAAVVPSPYGRIRSEWKRTAQGLDLLVTIPVNTQARLCIPWRTGQTIYVEGKPVDRRNDFRRLPDQKGYQVYAVGSGTYQITVR